MNVYIVMNKPCERPCSEIYAVYADYDTAKAIADDYQKDAPKCSQWYVDLWEVE